jgi:maleate isomerase
MKLAIFHGPGGTIRPTRIGMITPSSNTVVEPTTMAVTAGLDPPLTTHYTRIEVKTISLEADSLAHFQTNTFVQAAKLLADASMDVIAWNGTAGAWQGLDVDAEVCAAITRHTGVPATTATLAQRKAFEAFGIQRFALAVPYLSSIRDAIVRTYAQGGVECCNSATLEITDNAAYAEVSADKIRNLVDRADTPDAQAIAIICTNLPASWLVEELEEARHKPVFDSTLVTIWHALQLAGRRDQISGWGRLFRQ